MAAAFCAWDGGRLQTWEENSAAFGASGSTCGATSPTVGGFGGDDFHSIGPAQYIANQAIGPCTEVPDTSCVHDWMNWSSDYQNPEGGNAAKQWDYAYFISAPGRFPHDKGAGGHMDIGGLMMELTASPGIGATTATDPECTARPSAGAVRARGKRHSGQLPPGGTFATHDEVRKDRRRCARDN